MCNDSPSKPRLSTDAPAASRTTGRPKACSPEDLEALQSLVLADPGITLKEIAWHMAQRMGHPLTLMTWSRALRHLGLSKHQGRRKQLPSPSPFAPPASTTLASNIALFSALLTDREWEALQPLLESPAGRGRPPLHDRRIMWSAVLYMVRSGTPWRSMPKVFPPHKAVFAFYTKVKTSGQLQQVTAHLHALWLESGQKRLSTDRWLRPA